MIVYIINKQGKQVVKKGNTRKRKPTPRKPKYSYTPEVTRHKRLYATVAGYDY